MLTIYEKGNDKLYLLRIKRRSYNCGNCVLIEKNCVDMKCNINYPCGQGYARYKFKEISEERYVKGR